MQKLLDEIRRWDEGHLSYESLGDFMYSFDFSSLEYDPYLPVDEEPGGGGYQRNILLTEPLEVVLIKWPPSAESAVHYHRGFYGYVVILEGTGQDVVYEEQEAYLTDRRITFCKPGGIIDEPDGVVHKIVNASADRPLVSLHFYYPALESMEGLALYKLDEGKLGILSDRAHSANWSSQAGHFKEIREDAFRYKEYAALFPGRSHRMLIYKPKPGPSVIKQMTLAYYDEQAREYDYFDFRHASRRAYTLRINELIGEDLKHNNQLGEMLSIAAGTGRRALDIRKISGRDFKITGIDMSEEMVAVARKKGLDMIQADWLELDMEQQFNAIIFLYAFGHVANSALRLRFLQKIKRSLKPGAPVYMDLFNIDDVNEWGPAVKQHYTHFNLHRSGYEMGDVFYKKTGGTSAAFLHYFNEKEVRELFEKAGLSIEFIRYVGYVEQSGELFADGARGFFFVKAVRKD